MSGYYDDLLLEIDDAFVYDNYIKISIATMVIYSMLDKIYKKKHLKSIKIQTEVNLIEDEKRNNAANIIQKIVKEQLLKKENETNKIKDNNSNKDNIKVDSTDNDNIDTDNENTSYLSYIPILNRFF